MTNKFKKALTGNIILLSSICISFAAFFSFFNYQNENKSIKRLFADDFLTDNSFIMFADTPPNPLISSDLNDYKELGMNVMLLTEDYTPMVDTNGQLTEGYKNSIRAIGDAGLQCWIRNMYNDADYFDNSDPSKPRSNYGTPYSLSERHLTDEFKEFDAVTGFYMADEPYQLTSLPFDYNEISEDAGYTYAAMDQYDKLVDWFNRYYGEGYSWHMNHVPSSSYNHWPENGSYESFLNYYADNIIANLNRAKTKTVSLDHYPFKSGTYNISSTYLSDLLTGALVTKQFNEDKIDSQKANFGLCIQAFSDEESSNTLRAPESIEEITYQIYTGMSLGAHTYEFFLYRNLPGLTSMVDSSGQKTDLYNFTKEAIARTSPLAKSVMGFDWQNLIVSKANSIFNRENNTAFNTVTNMVDSNNKGRLNKISSTYDASVGYFTNDNNDGYLIANQSKPHGNKTNTVTLTFNDTEKVLIFHEGSYYWQNLNNGELQLDAKVGDGYFVIVPEAFEEIFVENGNHYARVAPTETQSGTKEYYVSCDDHRHYVLEDGKMYFRGVHFSNSTNIQVIIANYTSTFNNGNNFLATDTGFNIDQTESTVAQAGWFSQAFVDGKYRLITACFNSAAVDGQVWVIKANSLLTDSDGVEYRVDKDYRFTYSASSSSWTMATPSLIPNGNWTYDTSLSAPQVDMEDDRYIAPSVTTFDISSTAVGYNASSVIQVGCDLNLGEGIYTDGGSFDLSDVRIYKNDVLTSVNSIQYFHTDTGTSLLSMNLGDAAGTASNDVLRFVAGSVFKITIDGVTYTRQLAKDTYYLYNGSNWICSYAANLTILPVSGNVQYNMVYIQCGNIFNIAGDTNASFTGTLKFNDTVMNSFSVTGTSGGFYFSGLGTLKDTSFTFSLSKYSAITCNNITALILSDYNVSFNGSVFMWQII